MDKTRERNGKQTLTCRWLAFHLVSLLFVKVCEIRSFRVRSASAIDHTSPHLRLKSHDYHSFSPCNGENAPPGPRVVHSARNDSSSIGGNFLCAPNGNRQHSSHAFESERRRGIRVYGTNKQSGLFFSYFSGWVRHLVRLIYWQRLVMSVAALNDCTPDSLNFGRLGTEMRCARSSAISLRIEGLGLIIFTGWEWHMASPGSQNKKY